MILFCDTSALVKFYVSEEGSEAVNSAFGAADSVALSRLAWVELHAAVARRGREVPNDQSALEEVKRCFAEDWFLFLIVEVSQSVVEMAGEYADIFSLRAYDAVQLASAARLRDRVDPALKFACFDRRLNKAASTLGMQVLTN
jgi:predicted nucleic acid-binding protein